MLTTYICKTFWQGQYGIYDGSDISGVMETDVLSHPTDWFESHLLG